MRIWRSHELGDPLDVLRLEEGDAPGEPGPSQVLIDTAAVGLTFPDVLSCRGEYQVPTRLPYTPGGEIAGVVSAVGEGVDLEVGTAVAVLGGGLREQNIVGAGSCFAYPTDALSPAQAAAIPVNYGTAWFGLHDRAKLQPGETVLITGAAGGTGTACIQLALAAGAVPIAIVGGEQKAACSQPRRGAHRRPS